MSYIKDNLKPGEKIYAEGRVSWWTTFWPIVIGIVLFFFTFIGVLVMVPSIFRVLTTEVTITDRRVIFKTGFISRNVLVLQYNRIEALQINQDISGRLLRYGDLMLSGAGNRMLIKDVAKAKEIMEAYYHASDINNFDKEYVGK